MQCCAGWRVNLVAMMCFDDFNDVAVIEHARRNVGKFKYQVSSDTHIRRHDDPNLFRGVGNRSFLTVAETSCADHHVYADFAAHLEMRERPLWSREIDHRIARG